MLGASLLGAVAAITIAVVGVPAAHAAVSTGHAVGYQSATSGLWIGSYALADGRTGFCVNLGKAAPTGRDFEPVDAASLGWYTPRQAARLAYISRRWAASTDPDTAAAAQLATWVITGTNGQSPASLAARAGAHAAHVLAGAQAMLVETNRPRGASTGVSAELSIERGPDGTDTVTAQLNVDFLAGTAQAPPDTADGVISLSGAQFADGSTQRAIRNGVSYAVTPVSDDAVVTMGAHAVFDALPYGSRLTIAYAAPDVQNLLLAQAPSANAEAHVVVERPTPKPFAPEVTTRTSAVTATAGQAISDELTVRAAAADGQETQPGQAAEDGQAAWRVTGPDGGPYVPIPVTVRSRLLGPFDHRPEAAAKPPADAPTVCEVATLIDKGDGQYTTPECTLPSTGYYVWVERIDAADTAPESGGSRVTSWQSTFGQSSETTVVPAAAAPVAATPTLAATGSDLSSAASAIPAGAGGLAASVGGVLLFGARRRAR